MFDFNFTRFLEEYKNLLSGIFSTDNEIHPQGLNRGIEPEKLHKITELSPLGTFIPVQYGGFGGTREALAMLEASSYESLPLSLMMGINGALFLQPVANYGNEDLKTEIFDRVLNAGKMGGLMITEPDYGSDALKMQTKFTKTGNVYSIKGIKHWQGLTGMADYWLMTARGEGRDGNLDRDISFFIHNTENGGIEVEEYFNNLGLYMIPYGLNKIDIKVDESHKLEPHSTGITMMLDILHRSRLQFPGMGMGFLRRMLDEAVTHCKQRFVGGQSLFNYDQVKSRLSKIQSYFTVCSAMCDYTASNIHLEDNTSRMDLEANSIKSVITDFMQQAAQSLLQLTGAKGYKLDHIAGRSTVDSRPFQIFEGSNDILYQQISESLLKMMRKVKTMNLYEFLKTYEFTSKASEYFRDVFNFELDIQTPQSKMVELGRAVGRMVSMEFTINLGEKGFNRDLIDNALLTLQDEINSIMKMFAAGGQAKVVEDYQIDSSWLELQAAKV